MWNGLVYRSDNDSYPNCSMKVASSLVEDISAQRSDQNSRWIALLPTKLSGCFNTKIVNSEIGTDEYWVINDNVVVAAISCKPPGSVVNPNCGVEMYIEDGLFAISGGYIPYVNIEKILSRFSQIVLRLSNSIPILEYRTELNLIFGEGYAASPTAVRVARRIKGEIDG